MLLGMELCSMFSVFCLDQYNEQRINKCVWKWRCVRPALCPRVFYSLRDHFQSVAAPRRELTHNKGPENVQ